MQFSEALSHPVPPMLVLIGAVFLNAACNWVLIYGNLGAPALGLEGAAWATLFARTASFLALLAYCAAGAAFRWPRADALDAVAKLRSLCLDAAPGRAGGGHVVARSQLLLLRGDHGRLAGRGRAGGSPDCPLVCLDHLHAAARISLAVSIRVGQAVGANEFARVRTIGLSAFFLGVGTMALCSLVFAFAGGPIARAFVNDPAVSALAARLLLAVAAFQIFDGLQVVASGALRGLSDLTVPMILCIVAYWFVELPPRGCWRFRST